MLMRSVRGPDLHKRPPAGLIVPAQSVVRDKVPAGEDWIHQLKHDAIAGAARPRGSGFRHAGEAQPGK